MAADIRTARATDVDALAAIENAGEAVENAADADMRAWARRWYDTVLPHCAKLTSPRTIALQISRITRQRPPGVEPGRMFLASTAAFRAATGGVAVAMGVETAGSPTFDRAA